MHILCGQVEGAGRLWRVWKGQSKVGETLDEGDPPGTLRRVSKGRHFPRFRVRDQGTHFFASTDVFESRRKISFRRRIHSSPTLPTKFGDRYLFAVHIYFRQETTETGERYHFAAHIHSPPKPATDVVSPPTSASIPPYDNCCDEIMTMQ